MASHAVRHRDKPRSSEVHPASPASSLCWAARRFGCSAEPHHHNSSFIRYVAELLQHEGESALDRHDTRPCTDNWERDRREVVLSNERHGRSHGPPDGTLRRAPEHVDPRHVNNGAEGEAPGAGHDRPAERNRPHPCQFSKWTIAAASLYRARYALRKQEPPRDDVAVPCVDDDLDILFK
jgi:hypothetical protein